MIKIKFNITTTILVGTLGLFLSILRNFEAGAYISGVMVLGRASIDIIRAWKGHDDTNKA